MEFPGGVHFSLEAVCPGLSRVAFFAEGRSYSLDAVVRWADWTGELHPFAEHWRNIRCREQWAEREDREPDDTAVEEFATTFRYDHDLTTAEECEQWLASRGLEPDALQAWALRQYWASEVRDDASPSPAPSWLQEPQTLREFCADLLLSDEFGTMAHHLAWRVALACEPVKRRASTQDPPCKPLSRRPTRHCLFQDNTGWENSLQKLESAFGTRCRSLLTRENRLRCLGTLRLRLLQLRLEILEVETESAAREASLLVKQDGLSLAQVAARGSYVLSRRTLLLEDLPPEWQTAVSSAATGTLLEPFERQDGYELCFLRNKTEPTLNTPGVRERLDAWILCQYFTELECRHVRWRLNLDLPDL